MPLGILQHYTIEPTDLEATKTFYCDVLGLESGDRPPLGFPGYWLYAGDKAVVHLMSLDMAKGGRGTISPLDHAAFEVADLDAARRRLAEHGVGFREVLVAPGRGQLFLNDPNGVQIELGGPVA